MRREVERYQGEYLQYKDEAYRLQGQVETDVDLLRRELTACKIREDGVRSQLTELEVENTSLHNENRQMKSDLLRM
jgi:hypothetical protein